MSVDLSSQGFTHAEVIRKLHSSNRQVDFRYELLDRNNQYIRTLSNVTRGSVAQNMLNQIKRTAKFSLIEDGQPINYLSDRIKPYMRLAIRVPFKDTQWIDFPLGVFLLSSPTRKDGTAWVQRDIDAYDLTLILRDDKFIDRYTTVEGTLFYDAIVSILTSAGITQYNIEQTDKVLPRTIEFEPGTDKLSALNEILSMINYTPIFVDSEGYFTSRLYVSPSERAADYIYLDDRKSVIKKGVEEELDSFNVPNVFSVIRTNEEEAPLVSTYINDNPDSPTSTVNRGRTIVDRREIDNIADQESLDAYVQRIAFEANMVYGRINWDSALMPFHSYGDVLQFRYEGLNMSGKYLELSWDMDLKVGGNMSHELRQVVSL